ncbi:MAG: serine protease [Victivallaceae bacterium]|nr:serine protease [Victivallaceae bacterium]
MKKLLLALAFLSGVAKAQPPLQPQLPLPPAVKPPAKKIIAPVSVATRENNIRKFKTSIIKVFAMRSRPNYNQPWQNYPQHSITGSGFVISGNRILTNAHLVADQTFLMVRKPGVQKKYVATLEAVGHECDLAILKVADPEFFKDVKPLKLGDLPELQTSVVVMGYPVGGDNISVTEGIISRIEPIVYSHSGRRLLAVQIDAAINPGNSGGPVLHNDRVVGIAFQGLSQSQSIGYMIPVPVVRHFLKDVEDKKTDGFPHVPFAFAEMENPDLRAWAKMNSGQTGVIICSLPPEVKASGEFKVDDVIMAIDGIPIDNDATVKFRNDEVIYFGYLIWRKYIGDNCKFTVLRNGREIAVDYQLRRYKSLVPRRVFDKLPTYYFIGGLLFVPLSINHLDKYQPWYNGPIDLVYEVIHGKVSKELQQIVVLSRVLAAEVNVGYQHLGAVIVEKVNGRKIRDLKQLIAMIRQTEKGFIIFQLKNKTKIVLDLEKLRKSTPLIMSLYRIPADRSPDLRETLTKPVRFGPFKENNGQNPNVSGSQS